LERIRLKIRIGRNRQGRVARRFVNFSIAFRYFFA
jgi:hypothetical protein